MSERMTRGEVRCLIDTLLLGFAVLVVFCHYAFNTPAPVHNLRCVNGEAVTYFWRFTNNQPPFYYEKTNSRIQILPDSGLLR